MLGTCLDKKVNCKFRRGTRPLRPPPGSVTDFDRGLRSIQCLPYDYYYYHHHYYYHYRAAAVRTNYIVTRAFRWLGSYKIVYNRDVVSYSLGQRVPNGQRGFQEHRAALEEYQVPDPEHRALWKTVAEQREEPLHREHVRQRRFVAGPCRTGTRMKADRDEVLYQRFSTRGTQEGINGYAEKKSHMW